MRLPAARRGSITALAVGVAVLALYVALQPGPRPESVAPPTTSTTTIAPTTTTDPQQALCALAREFEEGARGQQSRTVAQLAETFYEGAREYAAADVRPEYEAAARYYTEYNGIAEQYDYEFFAIMGSPDGQRFAALVFGEPLGVNPVRYTVVLQCGIELPPPPTITTTTTRPRTTRPPATSPPATEAPAPTPAPAPAAQQPPAGAAESPSANAPGQQKKN